MKKIFLFLILFLFPLVVFAKDTCDSNDIKIQSIKLEKSTGNIEEVSEASISNQKINLGLKMNVLGDAAEYKIVLKNNSNEDYYFDEESLDLDMESVNYEFLFDDNTNLIKGGEEKVLYLKVSYKEKIDTSTLENGLYNGNQVLKLNVMNLENPYTGRFLGLLIFISLLVGFFVLYKDKKKTAYLLLLISFIMPFSARAVCRHSLEIDTNLVIDAREAMFLPGLQLNYKMKELAGDDLTSVEKPEWLLNTSIIAFKYSENMPSSDIMNDEHIASTAESSYPIYIWYDNGTIYWWSEDRTPSLNASSFYLFCGLTKMSDASGVINFDLTSAFNISYLFDYCQSLSDLKMVSNWNTSNVYYMFSVFEFVSSSSLEGLENWDVSKSVSIARMFQLMEPLNNIEAIEEWDVSNVTDMRYMFQGDHYLTDISALRNWNVSKVETLQSTFCNSGISSLEPLENWDVSNVVNMYGLFADCVNLVSLKGIEKWNTSNVTNMSWIFAFGYVPENVNRDYKLQDFSAIRNWDTSKVEDFSNAFYANRALKNSDDIKNWDTSNVKNMNYMFCLCSGLIDLDLSNWNTSNVTGMYAIFDSASNLESINLSNWDTSNVTNMGYMFSSLEKMREIDISSFNTSAVTVFKRMFNNSNALEKIYVGENWNTSANTGETKYVFSTISNLPNFSNTNPNYRDLSYAHTGEGGYLTLKTN